MWTAFARHSQENPWSLLYQSKDSEEAGKTNIGV